jgi:hypothetical protein
MGRDRGKDRDRDREPAEVYAVGSDVLAEITVKRGMTPA